MQLCLALYCLLAPVSVPAHLPAIYGKVFVRSKQSVAPQPAKDNTPCDHTHGDDGPDEYRQQIELREKSGGPYEDDLAQPLSRMGQYHKDQCRYKLAAAYLEHALHVVRVNEGLHTEGQIPLIRDLLDTYRLMGDQQALDDTYKKLFRVHGSGQPPHTDERKAATLEFLRWQREAFALGFENDRLQRLVSLCQLNRRLIEDLRLQANTNPAWHRELVASQLRNLYLVMGQGPFAAKFLGGTESSEGQSSHANSQTYVKQQFANIQSTAIARGRRLMEELLEQPSGFNVVQRAELHLKLGDWLQWNGQERRATREYKKVVDILQEADKGRLLEQWLGEPAELPAEDVFEINPNLLGPVLVTASYNVSKSGQVRSIDVSVEPPDNIAISRRIRRWLTGAHFRPRFSQGFAEPVERLTRTYQMVR